MKVSLNIVKQYINFELPSVDELVPRVNAQLGGVEEVINLGEKYKDTKIVKVVECKKHPNADKLSVCLVDVGSDPLYSKFYIPNSNLVQIVCGANNVKAGMWAAWLPPESTVPATYSDEEPFVLSSRELRGAISNGMLASARELGIGDDHDGIVDIIEYDLPIGKELVAGVSFSEIFGLDDIVIDIENKMFTHRPDLFGQLGVAREIAGIFGQQFTSPDWYLSEAKSTLQEQEADSLGLEVFNDAPEGAPRLMAVAIKGVEVRPSPLWLQCALVAMGSKPINNIVDATNYIMLMTAQPTHAYDYDKLRGHQLGVRMAHDGEELPLLNGKTYSLTSDDVVIADGEGAIGLAGIMGGGNSEVSVDTKNIVLEVANFNMYAVRKSSMRHGLFTDALTRFNKGQSPLQTPSVMARLIEMVGGRQASPILDSGGSYRLGKVEVTNEFINQRLGLKLKGSDIKELLSNVEIKVSFTGDSDSRLIVQSPFWRTDLELPEDIVEEVGRLYGYHRLPHVLPFRSTKPAPRNSALELMRGLRLSLSQAGANEVLTYSFVHDRVLRAASQSPDEAYSLSNALSPDLKHYRLSLTPSLLDKVHANIKSGHDEFALFEIGKTHSKKIELDNEGLPAEVGSIALVYASKLNKDGASFYRAKILVEFLSSQLGVSFKYDSLEGAVAEVATSVASPFEPKRSAIITDAVTGAYVGVVGEYNSAAKRGFKLPEYASGFELDTEAVLQLVESASVQYKPLGRFPGVERDISLKVSADKGYSLVEAELRGALSRVGLDSTVEPIAIYQSADASTKNITFSISLASRERTLVGSEVNNIIDNIAEYLKSSIDAEVV